MGQTIRVLVVDDHPVVRQGLAIMLSAQQDIALVGEAADGEEAVQKTRDLRPDVVVMDLKMPVKDGLTAIREIAHEQPTVKVLALAGIADERQACAVIRAGAHGLLLKEGASDQLIEAIRAVYQGTSVLHPTMAQNLAQEIERPRHLSVAPEPLTPRELDILGLIAQGSSNKEIARQLYLTPQTVMTHVRNILGKLHLANRTQAALYARDHGLT